MRTVTAWKNFWCWKSGSSHPWHSSRRIDGRAMRLHQRLGSRVAVSAVVAALAVISVHAQGTGSVQGTVTFSDGGAAVHGAVVLVVGAGLVALTAENGEFEIETVPVGTYEILAQRDHLTAARQTITVEAEHVTTVTFTLELSPVHEEVTVTATPGGGTTAFEAFNAITTLDSFELLTNVAGTLGDALENQPGVAKRSFGPGSSRPIIRGFDGDRVLIMEDGIGTGDLASQSGDHGVTIDPNGLERIEVVRGPATLLYGSNAVGGVVNAVTPHESYRDSMVEGTRGQLSADAGTANRQAGTNASLQHASGDLMMWAGGGARRSDDYETPEGTIENSETRLTTGRAGVGYFGERLFASGGFTLEDSRYGVPFAGELHDEEAEVFIDIDSQRRVGRFDVGMQNVGTNVLDAFRVVVNVIDWGHDEIEIADGTERVGTKFNNRTYVMRAEFDQRQTATLSGKYGVWTKFRNYVATGEEALAPPTDQTAFAAFGYEELAFGPHRLQLGGRVERNAYTVDPRTESDHAENGGVDPPEVRDRDFTGMSASVGFQTDLGEDATFVTNVTRSYRAPALEELYNFGPHVGNLLFEIGNPDLERESTLGLDLSVRHQSTRLRGDFNVYVYDIDNFVFAAVTDEVIDGLSVAEYLQGDSRFIGFDAKGSVRVGEQVWVNLGLGLVDAKLTRTNEALPRIPPLRGQLSVDVSYRGFTITPEWIFASKQDRVFRDETETDGYSVLNMRASYVWPKQHMVHILSVAGYNLTNELYRNHTSFIKDLAPEIGRGVKFGYSLRFF